MLKNYFLITLRNLLKNKLHIFINVFGMGISIACCIIGYFNYEYNASFDENHTNASTIYRVGAVREFQNEMTHYGIVPVALGAAIKQNIPEVDDVARYAQGGGNFRIGTELFSESLVYVDPSFFKLFTFEFVEGNGDLKNESEICISDEMATKFFGKERALGKAIPQLLDSGKVRDYVVAGVFKKQPANSSFFSGMYTVYSNEFKGSTDPNYTENTWYFRNTLFVQIKDPSRVSAIRQQLTGYAENNNKVREDFIIREFDVEPFVGMAVRDSYDKKPGTWTRDGSPLAAVIGVGMMGLFVLLIAIFNLTNTSIAISSRRLKEIGIRKVMGSTRKHLIYQFIGETAMVCLLALVVGFAIEELFLMPAFNNLWPDFNLTADFTNSPKFVLFMAGMLVFTSLLAGAYPAFYISKFQPTTILKGTQKFGGTNWLTRTLLLLQFAISLTGVVCGFAFTDNANFQRNFDMGFDKNNVIQTNVENRSEYETYKHALEGNDDIIAVTGTKNHLYASTFMDPIKHGDVETEVEILDVSADYLQTTGLTLKEGRNFMPESETDRKESVIITEGLARKLGMAKALGQEITWLDTARYFVVGVVQDVYNRGLWRKMEPVMFRYMPKEDVERIVVRAVPGKLVAVNQYMEKKWKEIFPNKKYEAEYMNEEMVEADTVNSNLVTMFVFLGVVALMLSATGLFTLVSLNIIKKMKEIGVRKVLGASSGNITKVINTEFVIILTLACCVGAPLGYYLSASLMSSIWDYYQQVTVQSMVMSAVILFAASALSIGYKIFMTTRLNPAHVLRTE